MERIKKGTSHGCTSQGVDDTFSRDYGVDFNTLSLGNPLEEKHSTEGDWRDLATTKLPKLKKLDGNHMN